MRYRYIAAVTVLAACTLSNSTVGQQKDKKNEPLFVAVPGMFYQQVNALGQRAKVKGREKTIYTGLYFDAQGKSHTAQVLHQLPNLVRLEGFKGNNGVISFNGKQANGAAAKVDDTLLEVFVMDYPEGLLQAVQESAAVRLLGQGFGPDPAKVPKYTGPRYDIYEVAAPIVSRKDQAVRSTKYYFDTQTGYLLSARYYDRTVKPAVKIETRFSMWGTIDGSAYPAQVDHYEDGKLVFSFIVTGIENGPALDVSNF
jgi:hypothetical protein